MAPNGDIGAAERRYLQAVYDLSDREAKSPVSVHDIKEHLGYSDDDAERCCDFWTECGALAWSNLGHVALTHVGLARAEQSAEREAVSLLPEDARTQSGQRVVRADDEAAAAGRVSVVIPVLNEAATIDRLVRLVQRSPRVLEVLAVDDGSIDDTARVAKEAGAVVITSSLLGKGASMEDGVKAAAADVILFLDGDLLEVREDLVERMTDPILSGGADLVKARFTRDAGRVTVLTARPLLSAFFPELAGFEQPLGGIVAVRRSLLRDIRLENDYGVDAALLIDAVSRGARVVEVDIGRIDHDSQPLEALGDMANQVTRVILDRAWRYERLSINQVLHMQEIERRARAQLLPLACSTPSAQPFALFDMDGVLLDGRYVVELADRVGVKPDLMRLLDSKILPHDDRSQAIAALFVGVSMEVFEDVARSMPLMAGAVDTVVGLRQAGYRVGIVTDSFHVAAEIVRRRVFADFCVAHVMHFRNGAATGEITLAPAMVDPDGCRRHAYCKSNVIRQLEAGAGVRPESTVAVGDGENDICMLRTAGTSVAFRPRSKHVERAAKHCVRSSLLEVLDLLAPDEEPAAGESTPQSPIPIKLAGKLARQAS